jgi:hypothetical protein
MPFDGEHFELPPSPQPRPGRGEVVLMIALGVLGFILMALPVPFAALADIAHYVGRRR